MLLFVDETRLASAHHQLVLSYNHLAAEFERRDDLVSAILYYKKCVDSAAASSK
jgi:hypothetical protein